MKRLCFFILVILSFSCSSQTTSEKDKLTETKKEILKPNFDVALKFINDYTVFCNNLRKPIVESNWIEENHLLTENFKKTYKAIIDSAYKEEPEVGLDFDPIFNGNAYPEKGFTILSTETNTGFVIVKGKNWEEFKVVLKVVYQKEKWLVDGSGIINIPIDKQIRR